MIYSSVLGSLYFLTSYLQACLRTEDAVDIIAVLINNTCILSYKSVLRETSSKVLY